MPTRTDRRVTVVTRIGNQRLEGIKELADVLEATMKKTKQPNFCESWRRSNVKGQNNESKRYWIESREQKPLKAKMTI